MTEGKRYRVGKGSSDTQKAIVRIDTGGMPGGSFDYREVTIPGKERQ